VDRLQWSMARQCPQVIRLVKSGTGLALVRDNETAGLSSRERDRFVELIAGTRMPIAAFRK
jgi:hypothetical protein